MLHRNSNKNVTNLNQTEVMAEMQIEINLGNKHVCLQCGYDVARNRRLKLAGHDLINVIHDLFLL